MNETITVSALNRYTKIYLESDEVLKQLLVEGEILNCKKYPSGHIYFSLKDEYSSVQLSICSAVISLLLTAA